MTKKILLLLVVAVIAISGAFSAQLIQIGGAAQYQIPAADALNEDANILDGLKDFSNYKFGLDARVNILFLNVSGIALFQAETPAEGAADTAKTFNFDTALTAGFTFGLGPVRATVGVGPNFIFGVKDKQLVGADGTAFGDFMEVVKASPLVYRADLSVNFGSIGIGASYMLNSQTTFGNFEVDKLLPEFDKGKISVALLFNLF